MNTLTIALEHAQHGFRVFLLGHDSKKPLISKEQGGNGCHDATTDEAQVQAWFTEYSRANIGIATGESLPDGGYLVVIDEDTYKGADTSDWNLPPTRTVRTARGGLHRYYRYDGLLPCRNENALAPGVCIKAAGGYVVGEGSVINGNRYTWVDEHQLIAELPERIAEMIRGADTPPPPPYRANGHGRASAGDTGDIGAYWLARALEKSGDGVGDTTGFWLACQLLIEEKHGAPLDVRSVLLGYAQQATLNPHDPFNERDVNRWIASANRSRIVQFGTPARSQRPSGTSGTSDTSGASYTGESAKREKSEKTPGNDQEGVNSHNSRFARSQRMPPAQMRVEAYHGLAGDIVRAIAPHTEADPDGVLVQFLTIFGTYAGHKTCFKVSADRHYPNLYVVLVGDTASGRKGMSWGAARYIFTKISELDEWLKEHTIGGMSSGEGLIHPVRDYREAAEGEDGKKKPPEPLQLDKRVLVRESEFSSVLKMPARDGNNLSEVQRRAWDGDVLQTLTKNSPERATGAHITIVGNITREELARYLSQTDTANGFANRYLWVHVARARLLPDGGELDTVDFTALTERLQAALQHIEKLAEYHIMTRDDKARALWHQQYERLTTSVPGLFGAMTARAAAQVMRLAMIYALLDCEQVIRVEHLEAALAVWEYVENSVRYLFGDALGDPIADAVLQKLRATSEGMTRTEISDMFARHAKATEIGRALALLQERQLARCEKSDGEKGRPTERWFAQATPENANVRTAKKAKKEPPAPQDDINSHNSQFATSQTPADDVSETRLDFLTMADARPAWTHSDASDAQSRPSSYADHAVWRCPIPEHADAALTPQGNGRPPHCSRLDCDLEAVRVAVGA